jgi:hypothetical protein
MFRFGVCEPVDLQSISMRINILLGFQHHENTQFDSVLGLTRSYQHIRVCDGSSAVNERTIGAVRSANAAAGTG